MLTNLLNDLRNQEIKFSDVLSYIENNYNYTASAFTNGTAINAVDQNQGSAKIFGLGLLENLSKEDTLTLFAEHYQSVLNTPEDADHQNIRQFMQNGWDGVKFDNPTISKK